MRAFDLWLVEVGRDLVRAVRGYWLLLLVAGAMAVAYLALRTPASPVASVAEVDAILRGGQPALVEFFSNT
jgi:hypothetical protein